MITIGVAIGRQLSSPLAVLRIEAIGVYRGDCLQDGP